jgi:hypothetical protein
LSTWSRHLRFFADVLRNCIHLWPKATNYWFSSPGQPGDKSAIPLIPAQLQQTWLRKASSFMSCMSNVNPIKKEPKNKVHK